MGKFFYIFVISSCLIAETAFIRAQYQYKRTVKSQAFYTLPNNDYQNIKTTDLIITKPNKLSLQDDDFKAIESYFLQQNNTLICQSELTKNKIRVITKGLQNNDITISKKVIDDLKNMGYILASYTCTYNKLKQVDLSCYKDAQNQKYYDKPTISASLINNNNLPATTPINKTSSPPNTNKNDCDECGEVKINSEALKKLKNADFGGDAIDFGANDMEADLPAKSNNTTLKQLNANKLLENKPKTATLNNTNKNDCDECGEVKVNPEALKKLKNADFGGDAIDFGADDMEADLPAKSNNTNLKQLNANKLLENKPKTATLNNTNKNDCDECGEVKINPEALKKLKNADFGGDAIDFGADDMEAELPEKSNNTTLKQLNANKFLNDYGNEPEEINSNNSETNKTDFKQKIDEDKVLHTTTLPLNTVKSSENPHIPQNASTLKPTNTQPTTLKNAQKTVSKSESKKTNKKAKLKSKKNK